MPLTARLGDRLLVSVDLSDDEWLALPRARSKGERLACSSCGSLMSPRQQHGREAIDWNNICKWYAGPNSELIVRDAKLQWGLST